MKKGCRYLVFSFSLLFAASFCNAEGDMYEVVGAGECADCDNFKTSQIFSELRVSIECKLKTGETKRIGAGKLDELGKFKIKLQENGELLKEGCYARLHDSSAAPCPAHDEPEAAKIIFKSVNEKKLTFVPTKNVRFSSAQCGSKFAWPYFKHPETEFPWKKKFPPIKDFLHPFPKPKVPVDVPHVPVYKAKPKLKPVTPHVPIYKPKPVGFDKTLPIPSFFKKKEWPKIHKKNFFHHPKFGYFAPLPPFGIPHYP